MKKLLTLMFTSLLLLGACGVKSSELEQKVEEIQANISILESKQSGRVSVESVKEYYTEEVIYWTQLKDAEDTPNKYLENINAQYDITVFMNDNVAKAGTDMMYLGQATGDDVQGLFFYHFADDVPLEQPTLDAANLLTTELALEENFGEYYMVKGQYIVTIDTSVSEADRETLLKSLPEFL
ncbi:hypothetical protein AwErysi_04980 [Erysipelotrichaceae bacterium]|nr:hypothetical protein AwErysi_04980 [Erysipelotrichaceae bacterium]